jgi:hypothetical protein
MNKRRNKQWVLLELLYTMMWCAVQVGWVAVFDGLIGVGFFIV